MREQKGLGNSVFQPKTIIYKADGSGRDVHCFNNPRTIDTMDIDLGKLTTSVRENNGRKKSPTVA